MMSTICIAQLSTEGAHLDSEAETLAKFIREETGYSGHLDPDMDMLKAGILDSFSIVSLAMFAQEQFGVEFEGEEIVRENLAHLSSLVALIRQKQTANGNPG